MMTSSLLGLSGRSIRMSVLCSQTSGTGTELLVSSWHIWGSSVSHCYRQESSLCSDFYQLSYPCSVTSLALISISQPKSYDLSQFLIVPQKQLGDS